MYSFFFHLTIHIFWFLLLCFFSFSPKISDDKSASDDFIAKEKALKESIADAKERIKSLKVDGENDDGKMGSKSVAQKLLRI